MADGFDFSELTSYQRVVLRKSQSEFPKESKKFLKTNATKLSGIQKKEFKKVPMDKVEKAERAMVKAYRKGFDFGKGHFVGKARTYTLKTMKSTKAKKKGDDIICRAQGGGVLNLISGGYTHKGGFKEKNGIETFIKGYKTIEKAKDQFEPTFYDNCREFVDEITKDL